MRLWAIEQVITDAKMMFIYFSIKHRLPYIIWIMKNFIKLSTKTIFELVHCSTCFFPFRWMCWWGCEQLSKLSRMQRRCLFTSRIIHKQPYITWIMKNFIKLSKLFLNIYICLNHCCWCEHNQHLYHPFLNRCGYFSPWLVIPKQGISIYLNFFIICLVTFIF